jgi:hypothetical protein
MANPKFETLAASVTDVIKSHFEEFCVESVLDQIKDEFLYVYMLSDGKLYFGGGNVSNEGSQPITSIQQMVRIFIDAANGSGGSGAGCSKLASQLERQAARLRRAAKRLNK